MRDTAFMELYHVMNRGVEQRTLYMDDQDRARFVHDIYEFNDTAPAANTYRAVDPMFEFVTRTSDRHCVVDIHGWCIMGNHYHLLLSETVEGGLTHFIRKLNVGYAMYFNERYKRDGTLFQGRTKKILIHSDAHFLHILNYIHLNPLDMLRETREWRHLRIKSTERALRHLDNYRWSSYLDYCGKKNFPSVINKELFGSVFKNYRKEINEYLKDIELSPVQKLLLE